MSLVASSVSTTQSEEQLVTALWVGSQINYKPRGVSGSQYTLFLFGNDYLGLFLKLPQVFSRTVSLRAPYLSSAGTH